MSDKNGTLLEIQGLKKYFPVQQGLLRRTAGYIKAVDNVSFGVKSGETLGVVGESGCGKTTLGRCLVKLYEPTGGKVLLHTPQKTLSITELEGQDKRLFRSSAQIIFQDPYASLNPRMTIGSAIMEPMIIHNLGDSKADRIEMAGSLMDRVGLSRTMLNRYPHEFSGGQRQRICIARALAVKPEFIVCDESVSALDVSIQAQILNLLLDLQDEFNLTYIFISHDLAVVKFISDELAVMNKGVIVEMSDAVEIYKNPKDEYTRKLLGAIPKGVPKELLLNH